MMSATKRNSSVFIASQLADRALYPIPKTNDGPPPETADTETSSEIQGMSISAVTSLPDRFRDHVEADPDRAILLGMDRHMTRRELWQLAEELSDTVLADKLSPQSVVAVAAPNGASFLAALLAIWQRSCVALLLDTDTPESAQRDISLSIGATALLTSDAAWPQAAAAYTCQLLSPTTPLTLADAAIVKLTSGTTGAPRGIEVSSAALIADTETLETAMGIGDADRILAAVPMSFSYGLGSIAMPALLHARQLILAEDELPMSRLTAARQCKATVLPTVPMFIEAILRRDTQSLPESIRLVISAGAPLRAEAANQFRRRFGIGVHVFYGASESGGITYDQTGTAAERGSVGTALPGVEIEIEPSTQTLRVRSKSVARGYLPSHPSLSDGCYQTQDQAEWRDNELILRGRLGSLINVGGHKVDPRRVEKVIAALPGVAEVLVTAVEGRTDGSTSCCAVVASPKQAVSRKDILAQCRKNLSGYECPRQVVVVTSLPRTPRGKISADAIRALIDQSS